MHPLKFLSSNILLIALLMSSTAMAIVTFDEVAEPTGQEEKALWPLGNAETNSDSTTSTRGAQSVPDAVSDSESEETVPEEKVHLILIANVGNMIKRTDGAMEFRAAAGPVFSLKKDAHYGWMAKTNIASAKVSIKEEIFKKAFLALSSGEELAGNDGKPTLGKRIKKTERKFAVASGYIYNDVAANNTLKPGHYLIKITIDRTLEHTFEFQITD